MNNCQGQRGNPRRDGFSQHESKQQAPAKTQPVADEQPQSSVRQPAQNERALQAAEAGRPTGPPFPRRLQQNMQNAQKKLDQKLEKTGSPWKDS